MCRGKFLNLIVLVECVKGALSYVNRILRSTGIGISASEAFDGVKLDFRELKSHFGEYVQVYDKHNNLKNSVTIPRSFGAIAMRAKFNGRGTWRFFDLTTNKFIEADNWKSLPYS